jgi:hypothetical protein
MYISVNQISGKLLLGGWHLVYERAKDLYSVVKHTSDLCRAQPAAQDNQQGKLLDFPRSLVKL